MCTHSTHMTIKGRPLGSPETCWLIQTEGFIFRGDPLEPTSLTTQSTQVCAPVGVYPVDITPRELRKVTRYGVFIFIALLQKWLSGSISLSFIAINWTVGSTCRAVAPGLGKRLHDGDNLGARAGRERS